MIENYAEKIKHESNGFIRHNGIRIVSVDEERSVLEAEITDNSRNVWGSVHGGFLYTMADTAAGAFARIRYGRRNVTLNGSMNYLRPTTHSKTLTAVGREIKVGGHVGFFEVNIHRRHRRARRLRADEYVFSGLSGPLASHAPPYRQGRAQCPSPFFIPPREERIKGRYAARVFPLPYIALFFPLRGEQADDG